MLKWGRVDELLAKIERKDKDPLYQKANKLKKLKVNALKKKLEKALKKESFKNLQFDKAEMGKYVIVPFSLEDAKDKRKTGP